MISRISSIVGPLWMSPGIIEVNSSPRFLGPEDTPPTPPPETTKVWESVREVQRLAKEMHTLSQRIEAVVDILGTEQAARSIIRQATSAHDQRLQVS